METKFYEMLVEQAGDAAKRTRWVLSAAMIISLAQLGAAYNFSFGFLRKFSEQMILATPTPGAPTRLKDLQDMLMRSWVDQLSVNVNLFGIKFSVADASLIGSISLLSISVWLFYSARRENHIIGKTCIIASEASQETKAIVFHGICNTQLFGTVSTNDEPISSLRGYNKSEIRSARLVISVLFYLPVITIFAMIATDVMSVVYLKAIFRGSSDTLYDYLANTPIPKTNPVRYLWSDVWPQFFLTIAIELGVGILLSHIIRSAAKFQTGTVKLLRELQDEGWGNVSMGESSAVNDRKAA
jgi:hypothetical protein